MATPATAPWSTEPDDLNAIQNIYGPEPLPDGDISFDCTVNAADILLVTRIMHGTLTPNAAQITRADVAPLSGSIPAPDGQVTTADLLLIIRKSLGVITF